MGDEVESTGVDATPATSHAAVPFARPIVAFESSPPPHEMLLLNQSRSSAWGDIGLLLLLLVGLSIGGEHLLVVAYRHFAGIEGPLDEVARARIERAVLVPVLGWRMIVAMLAVGALVRHRGGSAKSVGATSDRPAVDLLVAVGTAVAIVVVVVLTALLLPVFFPSLARQFEVNADRIMERIPPYSPTAFAGISLMIGVYEELVFRGFLMPRLRRATGSWTMAVLVSTAVFSVLHLADQVPAALILVAVLSLTLSLVTIWRRSIVPAVVAHALFDFGMFLQLRLAAGEQWK